MQIRAYGESEGRELLRALAESGRYVFSAEQAHAVFRKLGIPNSYETVLLSSLAKGQWLQRLRRGLYALTNAQIPPFAIATKLVEPSAISHWSALNHHGLTEQIPQTVFAFTPMKVVTPSMRPGVTRHRDERHAWRVLGVRYQYMTVKRDYFFGIEQVWMNEQFRIPITDKERTVLETFASPRFFGGMGEALSLIDQNIAKLDIKRLVDYAIRYKKVSVAKRLGWALERAGVSRRIVSPLKKIPVTSMAILDPTRPRQGPYNADWQIQENLSKRPA